MKKSGSKDEKERTDALHDLIELDKTTESVQFFNRMITSVCMLYNYPIEYVTTTLPMWDVFILYEYGRDAQEIGYIRHAQHTGYELFGGSDKKDKGKDDSKQVGKKTFMSEVQIDSKRRYAELDKYTINDIIIKGT